MAKINLKNVLDFAELSAEPVSFHTRRECLVGAATRAAKNAGLVEQAATAQTESECADALANYEAQFFNKGFTVAQS